MLFYAGTTSELWTKNCQTIEAKLAMVPSAAPCNYLCGHFPIWPHVRLTDRLQELSPALGITGSEWVGFEHFIRFLNYPDFWKMIRNTLSITLYSLCTFPCAIIFALLLNEVRQIRLKKSVQMITYAPHFMSEVVVCSLVMMMLDRGTGPLNALIEALGGTRTAFISNPGYFSSIYVWSDVWQNLGWGSILYISALASISPEQVRQPQSMGRIASRLYVMSTSPAFFRRLPLPLSCARAACSPWDIQRYSAAE